MKTYLLRGVPASLQMDSWWLSATPPEVAPPDDYHSGDGRAVSRPPVQLMLLMMLIAIADWLFWGFRPGISLVLFAVVLAMAILLLTRPGFCLSSGGVAAGILIAGLLPALVHVQALSLLFGVASLLVFAAFCACRGQGRIGEIIRAAIRFLLLAPQQLAHDMLSGPRYLRHSRDWQGVGYTLAKDWLLPALVGTVFLALLLLGNPMFEHLFNQIPVFSAKPARLVFWAMMLAFVWPFLGIETLRQRMLRPFKRGPQTALVAPRMLNVNSVRNSLVLFNLMFASQTALDVTYLWGGAELPEGMTLASYAHRGAYPLVATALLAGLFALISRPYVRARPWLKGLLLLWLVQNLALVGASEVRLQFYVDSFGLTYLRLAAFIWMGMVAAGLMLIGWQVWRAKGNGWLLVRIAALLVAVLYICSLINFANLVAASNLARAGPMQGFMEMDRAYVCGLGPMALPAITQYESAYSRGICAGFSGLGTPAIDDWREWGFRKWQIRRYLVSQQPLKDAP